MKVNVGVEVQSQLFFALDIMWGGQLDPLPPTGCLTLGEVPSVCQITFAYIFTYFVIPGYIVRCGPAIRYNCEVHVEVCVMGSGGRG